MSGKIQEFYTPQPVGAGVPTRIGIRIHGIIVAAAGTMTIVASDGTVLANAVPTAVGYNKFPMEYGTDSMTVTSSVAGTLLL